MGSTSIPSWGCFVLAIPCAIVATREIVRGVNMPIKTIGQYSIILCALAAFAGAIGLGFYIKYNPPKPDIRIVEKLIPAPCPLTEQKTGPATARGGHDATAHSGNGDTFNAAPPQAPPANTPH